MSKSHNGHLSPSIVKKIFDDYENGIGFDAIARSLSKQGVPTPSTVANKANASNFWHGSTIKKILSNPHYLGDLVQGREKTLSVTSNTRRKMKEEDYIIVANTHPSLISREKFEIVQKMMKLRSKKRPNSSLHLFTNFLYCSVCQKKLWYRSNREGYICGSYSRHGKIACSNHFISEEALTMHVT